MHSRWSFIAPNLFVSVYSASAESAVAVSDAAVHEQIVFLLPRGEALPHPACCHTSASGQTFHRRRPLSGWWRNVPFLHGWKVVRLSARQHPYRWPALSAHHRSLCAMSRRPTSMPPGRSSLSRPSGSSRSRALPCSSRSIGSTV